MEQKNLYKMFGILWEVDDFNDTTPRCPHDNCQLNIFSDMYDGNSSICPKCGEEKGYDKSFDVMGSDVVRIIESANFKKANIINLENEYFVLSEKKSKNEKYWLRVSTNEDKKGDTQVMILAGSTEEKNKTQLFLDINNEKLSFDQNDTTPLEIFAKVEATFKNSKATITSKK